jgi:hypothetical protein
MNKPELTKPQRNAVTHAQALLRAGGVPLEIGLLYDPGTSVERAQTLGRIDADSDSFDALLPLLRQASGANARAQANVLVRPAPEMPHALIILDDLPTDLLREIAASCAASCIETSPGQGQARILINRALSPAERTAAQRHLAQRWGADGNAISHDRWGRLAGFKNMKPGRGNWTNLVADTLTTRSPMPAAQAMPTTLPDTSAIPGPVLFVHLAPKGGACSLPLPSPVPAAQPGDMDESRREFAFACHRLRAGWPAAQIERLIARRALARGKRRNEREALLYAQKTLKAAQRAI